MHTTYSPLTTPLKTTTYTTTTRQLQRTRNIRYSTAHLAVLANQTGIGYTEAHILNIAGRYNGAGPRSDYAKDVLTLYKKYKTYLG